MWLQPDGNGHPPCPFPTGPDILFVGYTFSAEASCYLRLGWEMPKNIIDLYAEYRRRTSGLSIFRMKGAKKFLAALEWAGLPHIDSEEKEYWQGRCSEGGTFTDEERKGVLKYCTQDVDSTTGLFNFMKDEIPVGQAIIRGRYMAAVASFSQTGVPLDMETFNRLKDNWEAVKGELVRRVDADYGVFNGLEIDRKLFEKYVKRERLYWPRTKTGLLSLKEDVFKDMAKVHGYLISASAVEAA
jgi:hypothetical protein